MKLALAIAFFSLTLAPVALASSSLNSLASNAAGKRITVNCENRSQWSSDVTVKRFRDQGTLIDGYTTPGSAEITLTTSICNGVNLFILDSAKRHFPFIPTRMAAESWGLERLLHESLHAKGITDETDTECDALALLPALFHRFHVPPLVVIWMTVYTSELHKSLPRPYTKHPCR